MNNIEKTTVILFEKKPYKIMYNVKKDDKVITIKVTVVDDEISKYTKEKFEIHFSYSDNNVVYDTNGTTDYEIKTIIADNIFKKEEISY